MNVFNVELSRVIAGPTGEVFDVWWDPACPGGPWHDAEKVLMNLAVDEMFYFGLDREKVKTKSPGLAARSGLVGHFGRFTKIERPSRVEHTWMSEHTYGIETTVLVTFEPRDGGTVLTIDHRGLPDNELGRGHERGWNYLLDRLRKRFESTS